MPHNEPLAARLADTPPSPPKNSGTISAIENTSSPRPRVIMAKGVPAFFVVTKPSSTANAAPVTPPTSGIRLTGRPSRPAPTATRAWMATKDASPV